jgi:pimeloyl-ACP methyl ester carboxylesterase
MDMPVKETNKTIRLPGGRQLGYAEFGLPEGRPVFIFHGTPGSRLDGLYVQESDLAVLNLRVIVPDRPGIGLSDAKPRRRISDWPGDMIRLATALGIEQFAIVGVTGGAPYAAACALAIPELLTGVAIVSGIAPLDVSETTHGMGMQGMYMRMAHRAPWLTWLVQSQVALRFHINPERALKHMWGNFAKSDQTTLARPELRQAFIATMKEAYRRGIRGVAAEMSLFMRSWGFRLQDIEMPVYLWQGGADINVPPAMGHYLAKAIPNCYARFYPNEGNMIFANRVDEIMRVLFVSA